MYYKRLVEITLALSVGFIISNLTPNYSTVEAKIQSENPEDCMPIEDVLIFIDPDGNIIANIWDTFKFMDSLDRKHFFQFAKLQSAIRGKDQPMERSIPLENYLESVLEKKP